MKIFKHLIYLGIGLAAFSVVGIVVWLSLNQPILVIAIIILGIMYWLGRKIYEIWQERRYYE